MKQKKDEKLPVNCSFKEFRFVPYEETLKFKLHKENRMTNAHHLDDMVEQFRRFYDILPPIVVNLDTMKVIDGQHRLRAYQVLVTTNETFKNKLLKVIFVSIPEENEMEVVISANNHSKRWSINDYVESYANKGNKHYQKLIEFCKTNGFAKGRTGPKYSYGAKILSGTRTGLKEGKFIVKRSEREVEDICFELKEIQKICNLQNNGYWVETLSSLWPKYRNKASWLEWEAAFEEVASDERFTRVLKNTVKQWEKILKLVLSYINLER